MLRSSRVPPRQTVRGAPPPFQSAVPQRGWSDALILPDTGILISAGRQRATLHKVAAHYKGRILVARLVADEINRQADPANRVDPLLRSAAAYARTGFVGAPEVETVDLIQDDVPLFDQVVAQLRNMPGSAEAHSAAHGGEAAVLAIAKRLISKGRRVVVLSNDGGAAKVAASLAVPLKHFGQVLRELVCAGTIDAPEAIGIFRHAETVSGVPSFARPSDQLYFECNSVAGSCSRCS